MNIIPHTSIKPRIGDILLRPKGLGIINHVGVSDGNGHVVHNLPSKGEHITTVEAFAEGKPVTVKSTGANPHSVLAKMRQILAHPKEYCLISRNCEHTASDIIQGKPRSEQLQAAIAMGIIGFFMYLAVRD
ncbi:cell wall-associated NlpC family hydrolase [Ereboglobus sp. PH5-10]|uniref:hypothetical protein n=1 Tax=Ereboglobus sp. PH5-10 TaxID=2940629 RepID=UPI002405E26D|nr:hypothetical protein [Ereboglobus sp. PH5-10]MDF9828544.1 cell wall-associated NlpC family hydrolase [Ereboglobus sp. PH5-10]